MISSANREYFSESSGPSYRPPSPDSTFRGFGVKCACATDREISFYLDKDLKLNMIYLILQGEVFNENNRISLCVLVPRVVVNWCSCNTSHQGQSVLARVSGSQLLNLK